MRTVRTVGELRERLQPARRDGRSIGLVPTMGALHEGHLSLVRRARERCDVVVVSLFVNPAQFSPEEDFAAYPRDEQRDAAQASAAGADFLFVPGPDEVYPPGFATAVSVTGTTEVLEGAARGPDHFRGVTTMVAKLFNMVGPDVAFFGQKDAQQAVVIRRMVTDLDFPVAIQVCPTVREADGLAMSSRNAYLDGPERERAVALSRALAAAERSVQDGERDADRVVGAARRVMAEHGVVPDYLALVSPETLAPLRTIDREALVAVAARVGPARLIDNTIVRPARALTNSNGRDHPRCNA